MKTLRISTTNKEEAIKLINNFRLQNKNKWYQIHLEYSPYIYKFKIYNTWIQLCYQIDNSTMKVVNTFDGRMDINIKQFKNTLSDIIR